MRFLRLLGALLLLVLSLLLGPSLLRAINTSDGVGLPASLSYAVDSQGHTLNKSILIFSVTLANNSSSAQTVQVQDVQTTPFQLFDGSNGSTLTAGQKVVFAWPQGQRFVGGLKWTSTSTLVQGSVTYQ